MPASNSTHRDVSEALRDVRLAGRFQRDVAPGGAVEWIFDVAHNVPAASGLRANLRALPRARTIAVCGILGDKDIAGITAVLGARDRRVDYRDSRRPACRSACANSSAACPQAPAILAHAPNVAEGCRIARDAAQPGERVLVFGSFLTVGPALDSGYSSPMDSRAKQRLTGAVILVALFVLLVPELLTGPRVADTPEGAPTDEGMHRYTIDLDASAPPAQPDSAAAQAPVALPPVADNRAQPGERGPAAQPRQSRLLPRPPPPRRTAEAARAGQPVPAQSAPSADAAQPHTQRPRQAPPPPTARGSFAVQLGTFGSRENADRLVRDMTAKGFAAFVAPYHQRRARALSGARRTDARPGRGRGPGCAAAARRPVGQHRADFVNSGRLLGCIRREASCTMRRLLRGRRGLTHRMIAVDYIILAIVIISAVMGLVRGLLREAIAVITWFLAIVLAWIFASSLEPILGGVLVGSPYRIWVARIIIFVFVLLLGGAVSVILGHYVRVSMFAGMDKFLGFVFGIIRGVVIVGAFTIAIQALRMDEDPRWKNSRLHALRHRSRGCPARHRRRETRAARFAQTLRLNLRN